MYQNNSANLLYYHLTEVLVLNFIIEFYLSRSIIHFFYKIYLQTETIVS